MKRLVKCADKLPKHNQYVLARLNITNWGDDDDPTGNRYWVVVKFKRGLSLEERDEVPRMNPRRYEFHSCDEHGNNLKPYCWDSFGPSCHFGQDVDVWCELPNMENYNG